MFDDIFYFGRYLPKNNGASYQSTDEMDKSVRLHKATVQSPHLKQTKSDTDPEHHVSVHMWMRLLQRVVVTFLSSMDSSPVFTLSDILVQFFIFTHFLFCFIYFEMLVNCKEYLNSNVCKYQSRTHKYWNGELSGFRILFSV